MLIHVSVNIEKIVLDSVTIYKYKWLYIYICMYDYIYLSIHLSICLMIGVYIYIYICMYHWIYHYIYVYTSYYIALWFKTASIHVLVLFYAILLFSCYITLNDILRYYLHLHCIILYHMRSYTVYNIIWSCFIERNDTKHTFKAMPWDRCFQCSLCFL